MIAIILSDKSQKRIESGRMIFHLSPIAMRLSRYAGATPGTGCCGDFPRATSTGRAPALHSS